MSPTINKTFSINICFTSNFLFLFFELIYLFSLLFLCCSVSCCKGSDCLNLKVIDGGPGCSVEDSAKKQVVTTTFASKYSKIVSLQEALQLPNIAAYSKRATGEKFLIAPHKSS